MLCCVLQSTLTIDSLSFNGVEFGVTLQMCIRRTRCFIIIIDVSASARSQWPSMCSRKYFSRILFLFFFSFFLVFLKCSNRFWLIFLKPNNLLLSCTRSRSLPMCVCVCVCMSSSRPAASIEQLNFCFVFHRMRLYCCRFTIGFNLTLFPFVSAIHFANLLSCSYPIRHKYTHTHTRRLCSLL